MSTAQMTALKEGAGLREARIFVKEHDRLAEAIGIPFPKWSRQCHVISLKLVKSGLLGVSRVARGTCLGVGAQHSWIVLGNDCYDERAVIIDPVLWSYDDDVRGISTALNGRNGRYTPFGAGDIWQWGRPEAGDGEIITLEGELSGPARYFLELAGPLDRRGWMSLANAPMGGWPSDEIISAMAATDELKAVIPIDILGMVTDRNPNGLYF